LDKDDWPISPDLGKTILMIAGKLGSRGNFSELFLSGRNGFRYRIMSESLKNFDAALVDQNRENK
jgi:hypothetical protein